MTDNTNTSIMPNGRMHPQGFYIDQIVEYARTSIREDDAGHARCSTFRTLRYLCKFIAANESIPESKVYPALRYIGYNIRYHRMKNGNLDPLHEIGAVARDCVLTRNMALIDLASSQRLFLDTNSTTYRMNKAAIAIAVKDADISGINLSELNLYNVLEGVNTIIENEPDYILLRDDKIVRDPLDVFKETKDLLKFKLVGMKSMLNNR